MSLLVCAVAGVGELLSRVKKAFGKADRSVASPTVFLDRCSESVRISFPMDPSAVEDKGCFVEVVDVEKGTSVDSVECFMDEDMGEELSFFELSDSPLFLSVEDDTTEEEDSFVPSLSSAFLMPSTDMNTDFYRVAFFEDMEEEPSSFELGDSSVFSWMEEEMEVELSSVELSLSPLFSFVEGEEMEVENSMVLTFSNSLSLAWSGVNHRDFYRIAFVHDELEEELSSCEPRSSSSVCFIEGVEMEKENCMVPCFSSTPSMMLDDTEKEIFWFASFGEDMGVEVSSVEFSDISVPSLQVEMEVKDLSVSLSQEGEVELGLHEQSSFSPAAVCQPEPVVVRCIGRHTRQPDHYGEWIYY